MHDGYDQALRGPAVRREIDWPADGYRLFEIGHFIGDRDWFDGLWESNCLFVPADAARAGRRLRRELLDGRRRLRQPRALRAARRRRPTSPWPRSSARARSTRCTAAPPPTTPTPTSAARAVVGYAEHFADLRGRGSAARASRCTTSARMRPEADADPRPARDRRACSARACTDPVPTGSPTHATPIPDELRTAVHRRVLAQPGVDADHVARATTSTRPPTDLLAYQELIARGAARLDHRDRHRRRRAARCSSRRSATCSATARCCRSTPSAAEDRAEPPAHHLPERHAGRPEPCDRVRELVGDEPDALVVLGSRHRPAARPAPSSRSTRRSCRSAPTW